MVGGVPAREPGWSLDGLSFSPDSRISASALPWPGTDRQRCAGINLAGAASRAHPGLALSETWAARVTDLSHVGVMGGCLSREQEYMYASTIQPAADEANSQLFAQ